MVPGKWVCVKAVIAARRSVPSKRERQAEESLASCLDVLVSGPWWRLRLRLSRWWPLVCTETKKAHGMRFWPCRAAYEALHGLVPAYLTRVTVLPVSVRGLLRTLSSGPRDVLCRLLPEQVPFPHTLQIWTQVLTCCIIQGCIRDVLLNQYLLNEWTNNLRVRRYNESFVFFKWGRLTTTLYTVLK